MFQCRAENCSYTILKRWTGWRSVAHTAIYLSSSFRLKLLSGGLCRFPYQYDLLFACKYSENYSHGKVNSIILCTNPQNIRQAWYLLSRKSHFRIFIQSDNGFCILSVHRRVHTSVHTFSRFLTEMIFFLIMRRLEDTKRHFYMRSSHNSASFSVK